MYIIVIVADILDAELYTLIWIRVEILRVQI